MLRSKKRREGVRRGRESTADNEASCLVLKVIRTRKTVATYQEVLIFQTKISFTNQRLQEERASYRTLFSLLGAIKAQPATYLIAYVSGSLRAYQCPSLGLCSSQLSPWELTETVTRTLQHCVLLWGTNIVDSKPDTSVLEYNSKFGEQFQTPCLLEKEKSIKNVHTKLGT